ncbi:MAG TPA: TonB-dependent receptor [Thermoanaerobaculia bacterium]|jgi:hypothetical protein
MNRFTALFALFLALFGTLAYGQTTTSTIRGVVQDESGNPFPGAVLVATNAASGFRHTATAGSTGNFQLVGLTPGTYTIEVSATSYKESTRNVTLRVGQTLDLDFRLTPDLVLTESITVVGSEAVETRTPELGTNVSPLQIESLPQNDRNFLNFAALAPGVLVGTDDLRKEIRAGAQSSSATNVFIDGVSFKNDVIQGGVVGQDASRGNPFPQNAVQEFRVITQNYSAEYQKASSAIITAITKSGSNTMSGDAFFYYQDKSLVADDPLTGANPEYQRNQYGFSVGGPIVRDRLHYFFSYEANDQDRENTVTIGSGFESNPTLRNELLGHTGTFVSPFRSDLAFAKASFQPGSSQLFDWSANFRRETDIRGFGDQTSRDSAENVKNDVWGTALRHQFTASTLLNELSLSYQDFAWNPQPLNMDEVGRVYENQGGGVVLRIGGRDTEQQIGQQRLALRDDVTFTSLDFHGSHSLKIGGNVEQLDYTVTKYFEENPRYFFKDGISATIPYKARWGYGNPDLSADNTQYGIYGQDDWAVGNKLILNLGLRWDYETNMFDTDYVTPLEVRQRLSDSFPANYFTDGDDREPKTDMFQPRLGFSYDLFANGRTVAFGGAGRYYDRNLFNNTLDERFRLQHVVGEFLFSPDGSVPGTAKWDPKYLTREGLLELQASGITGRPEVFLVDNNTEVPYSDQWNIGVRQTFGNMVAAASYSNIKSYNGFTYIWGAGFCCPNPPFDPNYSNVLISNDDVRTWYDAVYLTLDRPFSGRYGFNVAYTWSDAEQIGGDLFSLDRRVPTDYARYGTPGTMEHRIVANAIVAIPWDVRASTLIQYSSGEKFRYHDFPNGFCGDNNCYVPRAGEGPSWTTVDLRFEKDFRFASTYRIGATIEAFNVFNEARYRSFEDFNPPEGNPNLGKPRDIVVGSQRRFQFGIRLGF